MHSWWQSFDRGDRMMLANVIGGAAVTLFIWWSLSGRSKYGGKGMR